MSGFTAKPVIVGIDGSAQAECAALWAVDEALRRHTVLRLIYVVRTDLTGTLSADEYRAALDTAKSALAAARAAVAKRNPSVAVEVSIAQGSPSGILLAESSDADLICLGSTGVGRVGMAMLGSTAATVAERAECAVSIVRPESAGGCEGSLSWVIVPINRQPEDDCPVIAEAVAEARYRGWPMLAVGTRTHNGSAFPRDELDRVVARWHQQFADVHIYPISCDTDIEHYLHAHPEIGGLVMIDATRSGHVDAIIGKATHTDHAALAVLMSRAGAGRSLPTPNATSPTHA